jgi:hypothetical protein
MSALTHFEVLDGRRYAADRCWSMPLFDVIDEALTTAYHEFRVPLDLPVPRLYLLSHRSDFTLLWVFEHFEGGSNDDLPKIIGHYTDLDARDLVSANVAKQALRRWLDLNDFPADGHPIAERK